jgi:hypothetical protein
MKKKEKKKCVFCHVCCWTNKWVQSARIHPYSALWMGRQALHVLVLRFVAFEQASAPVHVVALRARLVVVCDKIHQSCRRARSATNMFRRQNEWKGLCALYWWMDMLFDFGLTFVRNRKHMRVSLCQECFLIVPIELETNYLIYICPLMASIVRTLDAEQIRDAAARAYEYLSGTIATRKFGIEMCVNKGETGICAGQDCTV